MVLFIGLVFNRDSTHFILVAETNLAMMVEGLSAYLDINNHLYPTIGEYFLLNYKLQLKL